MELIGMSTRVINLNPASVNNWGELGVKYTSIYAYANFLKLKLGLGMFIPCDKEGNVLEKPILNDYVDAEIGCTEKQIYDIDCQQYQEALDRVIFEGFEYFNNYGDECIFNKNLNIKKEIGQLHTQTIEDLTSLGLTIKESAVKKYNLT